MLSLPRISEILEELELELQPELLLVMTRKMINFLAQSRLLEDEKRHHQKLLDHLVMLLLKLVKLLREEGAGEEEGVEGLVT